MSETRSAPIKNRGLARVKLVPVTVTNPDASSDEIELKCTSKSFPGVEDAATWKINNDDPEQEIAETVAGKFGGINVLEFTETYDAVRMVMLTAHAGTKFDVVIIYNDPDLDFIVAITVPDCRLVSPGSTSSGETDSAADMVIKLQPKGGGKIADCIKVELTDRT